MGIQNPNSAPELSEGICAYLDVLIEDTKRCIDNNRTTAIHNEGVTLQVYRQFKSSSEVASSIRRSGDLLPAWSEWSFWKSGEKELKKLEREVITRMERHGKQHSVYTRGVLWGWRPVLIHAYKFEPDPILKLELVIPRTPKNLILPKEQPLHVLSHVIALHDHLVPSFIASPEPFYKKHDANFLTLFEYLKEKTPSDTVASYLLNNTVNEDGASHSKKEWKAEAPSLGIYPKQK